MIKRSANSKVKAFTIVELLVVIVVIGILASITIVSYRGITQKATNATLQSDLANASKQLKIYQATYGSYPTTIVNNCPTVPNNDTAYCLKASNGNTFTTYTSDGTTFNLIATNTNGSVYNVTDSTTAAVYVDPWAADWYPGITATALAGKHVYKIDLGLTYAYKTTNDAVASPQGATGLDPDYSSKMSLVDPQINPLVDFSAYPAQAACKLIGGRLPNMQELSAIYVDRATYGNNFQANGYWSSTEQPYTSYASLVYFNGAGTSSDYKAFSHYVRCVSG